MYVIRARTRPTSLGPSCWRHPSSISLISKQMGANEGKGNVLQILKSCCNATCIFFPSFQIQNASPKTIYIRTENVRDVSDESIAGF